MRKSLLLVAPAAMVLAACGSSPTTRVTGPTSPKPSPAASTPIPASQSTVQVPSTSRSGSSRSIQVLEVVSVSTYTPSGGQPRSGGPTGQPASGDQWAFTSILQQNGSHVGTDHVSLVFAADGTATVTAAESFANGQITAHGSVPFDRTIVVPVISGTGAYSGSTGTLTVVSHDPTHNNLTFGLT